MSRRSRSRNRFQSGLNANITNSATSFALDSAAGLSEPVYLVIDPDNPAKVEYIHAGDVSGNTLGSVTRGLAGSAAGAQAHDGGTVVRAVPVHQWIDDIFDDIEDIEGDVAGHTGAGGSSHAAATGGTAGFMSSSDKTKLDGIDAGAQADHAGLSGVSADQHHTENHQARHAAGGADALSGNLNAVARVNSRRNSTGSVFARRQLNFIEGTGIALTHADDAGNEEVDLTISLSGSVSGAIVPTGLIAPYGGTAAPSGWQLCDGTAISRSTFSALFAVIGTTYGAGNGSTTFNLPDMRQRFPMGKAVSGTGATLGGTGGTVDHTHTQPTHTHTGPSHSHSGPSHTHGISGTTSTTGNHTHGVNINSGFMSDVDAVQAGGAQNGGDHVHNVNGNTGADGSHNHTFSDTSSADGTGSTGAGGTGATGASGNDATGTANPPFQTVNYIIKE